LRSMQFNLLRYAEPRAVFEWQSFYVLRPLMKRFPTGDGHPVIVFPGFVGNDRSTKPMRSLLDDLGYETYGWGMGTNLVFNEQIEAEMVALVREVADETGRKVSLLGWSLGGLFAREVAKICPEQVRCVISMGSPISGDPSHSYAHKLYKAINGDPIDPHHPRYAELNTPPSVPTVSIYSKTDGIVAWEGSVQKNTKDAENQETENIEVPASHLGLGVNPLVMYVLADRLAQAEGTWTPFKRSGLKRLIYRTPKAT